MVHKLVFGEKSVRFFQRGEIRGGEDMPNDTPILLVV